MTNSTDALNKQLFQELDDKAAENCNGGVKVFTIRNQVRGITVGYQIDGRRTRLAPGKQQVWDANRGIASFDYDVRNNVNRTAKRSLAGGKVYAFRWNARTPGNPYDIELYRIG